METMSLHPDLLSKSLGFFLRLYHTYHLPFGTPYFRPPVHGLCEPAQGPCLIHLPDLRVRCLQLREDFVLQRYLALQHQSRPLLSTYLRRCRCRG